MYPTQLLFFCLEQQEHALLRSETPDEFIINALKIDILALRAKAGLMEDQLSKLQKAILECEDWEN